MEIEFEFYGTLRDAVGEKTVTRDVEEAATVTDAARLVAGEFDGLTSLLFRSNGEIRPNVTVSVNGDPVLDERDDELLSAGDTVVLAPGVSGGTGGSR